MVGFDYRRGYKGRKSRSDVVCKNVLKNVLQKSSQHAKFKHKNISEEQRLNNIFQMCLELYAPGDRLSLTSPKNFVIQYFTVSRNQPVKICCGSQCSPAGQDLRKQECKLQPACSELPHCKSSWAESPRFANSPKKIDEDITESCPRINSPKEADNRRQINGKPCSNSRRGCSSIVSACESLRPKKNTSQQTEPELSWQERCSNFLINLPVTLSDKLFGPRIICDESNDCKRAIFDDNSKLNTSQPVPKYSLRLGTTDQGNKKSVKSQTTSTANRGCYKNIGTDRVCLENVTQVDPCQSRTFHSVLQEDTVPCGRSGLGSENCKVTRKKIVTKGRKSHRDSFPSLKNSAESDSLEPRFKCGARNSTSSSYSEQNKRGVTSSSVSNWPAILSEKFFGPRNGKVLRPCIVNHGVIDETGRDGVADSPEIVFRTDSPSAEKKGRLLLKKYTISQTPEAMEETLCFNLLDKKQPCETRTKLHSKVCVKFASKTDNQRKVETVQKHDSTGKYLDTEKSHTSKRCVKSKPNYSGSSSRKIQQLEKKTSTEHIFLTSLIMKLLNRSKDDKDASDCKKCHKKTASGQSTVSRKYATTSIHKRRNTSIKNARYVAEHGRKNGAVSCSWEQKVSADCFTGPDFVNVAGKEETRREIARDYSSGKREVSAEGSKETCFPEKNLESVRDSSRKVTHVMKPDYTDRLGNTPSSLQEGYQDCDSHESAEVKDRVKSGVLQVIDKSCRREARGLCSLHGGKRQPKFTMREKNCKGSSSSNKFASGTRRNRMQSNDSHSECRGCFDRDLSTQQRGTTEIGISDLRHWDKSVAKQGFRDCDAVEKSETSSPENCNVSISHREESPRKQCHSEQSTAGKACEGLIINGNDIPDLANDRRRQFLDEGPGRTFVIVGENICVKTLYDRETITDDFPGLAHCQQSEFLGEQKLCLKTSRDRFTPDKNTGKMKTCTSPSQKPGPSGSTNVHQISERSGLSREPRFKSPGERLRPEQNGNGARPKQSENSVEIMVCCEECVGLPCEDNVCRVRPEGIPKENDVSGTEPGVEKVFSPLCQEASEKRENKVSGSETCPYKASIKSESKEALPRRKQSRSRDDECSSPLVAANSAKLDGQSDSKREDADDCRPTLNQYPEKSERLDGGGNIDDLKKRESCKKSSGKDLSVTKPESRNIINSYYPQMRSDAFPRCEVRNDEHEKVKKEKIQRDGSAAGRGNTKARRPLQRIENVRQASRTANVVIKNDRGKKQVVEKENSIVYKKTPSNQDGGVFDNEAKGYSIQNDGVDNSNLANDLNTVSTDSHIPSIKKSGKTGSVPTARSTVSKIPRKLGPLTKSKSPKRAFYSTAKTPESRNAKLKESFRRNWLKKENSGAASSKADEKETRAGEAGKIAESESSNRVTGSIDICDTKGSETHKELQTPAYIFDRENVEARTLQIEPSSIEEQNIQNGGIVKGTSETPNTRGSSKSSKSPSRQRDGEQYEDGKSRNTKGEKKRRENLQSRENQSKSANASKKNEKNKKSTPPSQNDSAETDTVTTNAYLFDAALMDGKNNIQSYSSVQPADRSEPKLFRPSKSHKASAKTKNGRKSPDSEKPGNKTTESFNVADKDRTKKDTNTSLVDAHDKNSGEGLRADAEVNEANVTGVSSSIGVNRAEMDSHRTCKSGNNGNRQSTVVLGSTKKVEGLKERLSPATNGKGLRQNSIALTDCNLKEICRSQRATNRVTSNDIACEKLSVCTHERRPCKFGNPTLSTKYGTPMSSFRSSSNSNEKRKQGACRDIVQSRKSPPCKSCGDKDALESNRGRESTKVLENIERQEIDCIREREDTEDDSEEVITNIGDCPVPKMNCKRSVNPQCNGTVSRILYKGISNIEKEIVQYEYDDVPEKLTTFCDSGRSDNDSTERNFRFTDDLKRLLDQGQDFFSIKKTRRCDDCQRLSYEERTSSSSILSLQKAYSALKTMLNKTKNIHNGLMYAKQTKGTQIHPRTLDESSILDEDCVKPRKSGKSLAAKMSEGNGPLILSISIGSSIFSNSSSPPCNEKHKKM